MFPKKANSSSVKQKTQTVEADEIYNCKMFKVGKAFLKRDFVWGFTFQIFMRAWRTTSNVWEENEFHHTAKKYFLTF